MANKRITDFSELSEILEDDYVLISNSENTYKAKVKNLPSGGGGQVDLTDVNNAIEEVNVKATAAQTTANEAKSLASSIAFKTIAEVTTDGQNRVFDFKTDMDGKAFSVTEIAIRVDVPAGTATASGYVEIVSENAKNWNNGCTFGYISKFVSTEAQTVVATVKAYGDTCAFMRCFKFSSYTGNSANTPSLLVFPGSIQYPGGKICWIRLSASAALPEGTVISVSGR